VYKKLVSVYGMQMTGPGGSRAPRGYKHQTHVSNTKQLPIVLTGRSHSQNVADLSNYGVYPGISNFPELCRTPTLAGYNLKVGLNIFNPSGDYLAGALYNPATGSSTLLVLFSLRLTRHLTFGSQAKLRSYFP
jgi:hypothetical protein